MDIRRRLVELDLVALLPVSAMSLENLPRAPVKELLGVLISTAAGAPLRNGQALAVLCTQPAAAVMVARAGRALRELGRAQVEIAPVPGVVTGTVAVGLLESAADLLAGELISTVQQGSVSRKMSPRGIECGATL
ncbi:hypothetical protein [Nocardia jiangxiensis]|uniref:hypothetical protein n=1 Tax=Nocardia jiangxiensis TaxID=282685 RepID=UPI0002E7BAAF|nr:hypothetical protein [Nocardia jiangxiensis]